MNIPVRFILQSKQSSLFLRYRSTNVFHIRAVHSEKATHIVVTFIHSITEIYETISAKPVSICLLFPQQHYRWSQEVENGRISPHEPPPLMTRLVFRLKL